MLLEAHSPFTFTMQLRYLYTGVALIALLSVSGASRSGHGGLPADWEQWMVPGAGHEPSILSQAADAGSRSKSIFDLNKEHFKNENFHSHAVKLSNGKSYNLGYHSVGGVNITWGDVIVDPKVIRATAQAEREAKTQAALLGLDESHLDASHPAAVNLMSIFADEDELRWPCPVPVVISADVVEPERVFQALEKISNLTHWQFVARTDETDYLAVIAPDVNVCASFIGRAGGQQVIQLGPGCSAGSAAHEFLHALGVYHEHTAANRDEYVRVIEENISTQNGIALNFEIQNNQIQVGDYDYNSIMHYGSTAFSEVTGMQTIEILADDLFQAGVCGIGQREELSFGDVATAHALYTLAPSFGSICASPDDELPFFPQCDQETEIRICGRQEANNVINGKYTQLSQEVNGRPAYELGDGDLFLYFLESDDGWAISSELGSTTISAFSAQSSLDPRVTTEWEVLGVDGFDVDPAVFGATCDFSDDGAIWLPGQPRATLLTFDGSSRCSVSSLQLVFLLAVSSLMSSLWC